MIIKNGKILIGESLVKKDILIENGKICGIENEINKADFEIIDVKGGWIIPGGVDIHAHLREPGYINKETVKSGTLSAVKGGITTIMPMPNLNPVPDSLQNLKTEQDILDKDSLISAYPFASVTKGEKGSDLSDIENLADKVKGFSDDGVNVENLSVLEQAIILCKKHNKIIASHAETKEFQLSEKSEYLAVKREIELVKKHKAKYHFCHISTKQSFDYIKEAREQGFDITCEVTPHHIALNKDMVNGDTNFKMNPPLRSEEDRKATISALLSGTATIIATDHAPHTAEDKAKPFDNAPNGIIGFETMFPIVYTYLVKSGLASYKQMLDWTVYNPAKRFELPINKIEVGEIATLAVLDIDNSHEYIENEIRSKGKNTPFINNKFYGFNVLTVIKGEIKYNKTKERKL